MKILLAILLIGSIAFSNSGCKSSKGPLSFCDTTCLNDTLKFSNDADPLKPYVYISAKDCVPDTLIWSYDGMGINRKMDFADLTGSVIRLNKNYVRCIINDTSYAWLLFNDCSNGRGYYLKIPFNKTKTIGRSGRAINDLDPKYSVAEGLVAYTDKGNIFVEEMKTGKKAMMTFGQPVDFNFDAIHQSLDSVNITPTRIWAKVKLNDDWKELEKNITLQ